MAANQPVNVKMLLHALIAIAIGIILGGVIEPFTGLKAEAMRFLGIFAAVIYLLVVDVFPDFIVMIFGLLSMVAFKVASIPLAFGELVGPTNTLITAALGIGVATMKSGLIGRISLWIMQRFPSTFRGQLLSIYAVGLMIAPLIPGATSKSALAGPIAASVSQNLGYENKSEGASAIFAATYVNYCVIPILFLSGSAWGITLFGFMPKELIGEFTWIKWFLSVLPWGLVTIVGSFIAVNLLYKPEPAKGLAEGYAKGEYEKLGPMPRHQKITAVLLVACMVLWMGEPLHKVPASVIAGTSLAFLCLFDILNRKEFRALIPWDSVIFIGGTMCFAQVFTKVGVTSWLAQAVGQSVTPLLSNIYLFILVLSLLVFLARTVIISQVGTLTIFYLALFPVAQEAGIHPWVTGFIIIPSLLGWNTSFSTTGWITAYYAANNGELVTHKSQLRMSLAYIVINIVGLWVSVPFWQMAGLIR